jgi:hypothetical protein
MNESTKIASLKQNGWETALGLLPFIIWPFLLLLSGLIYLVGRISPPLASLLDPSVLIQSGRILVIGLVVLTAIVILGGLRGWPDWAFSAAGLLLQASLLIEFLTLNGVTLGNAAFARTAWVWGAWLPEILVLLGIPLIARSLRPYQALGAVLRHDWTRLSFLFYAMLPIAAIAALDEMRFGTAALMAFILALALGALAYLRSTWKRWRVIYLAVAFWFTWAASAVYIFFDWRGREAPWLDAPANGWDQMASFLSMGGFMLALLSLPGIAFGLASGWGCLIQGLRKSRGSLAR